MEKLCKGCGKPMPAGSRARFHNEDCRKMEPLNEPVKPEIADAPVGAPTDEELQMEYEAALAGTESADIPEETGAEPLADDAMAAAAAEAEESMRITLTPAQLQKLLAAKENGGITFEQMLVLMKTFAEEMRKPDPETAEKLALEKHRRQERKRVRTLEIQREMAALKARQDACLHRTEKGRSIITGQVHTGDGLYHPICQRCGKEFPPRVPQGDVGTASANFFGAPAQEPVPSAEPVGV